MVDKLITLGKKNTLHAKRAAFAILIDHDLVSMLFNKIAPRFKDRQGGYTRLIKYAVNRQGDNARMTLLELTERENKVEAAATAEKVVEAEVVNEKPAKTTKASQKKAAAKKA
jgi:large subunit ribosomal protein L17